MIQNWLNITPASEQSISLMESMTFNTEVLRAQLWYRGDADELYQFFRQLNRHGKKTAFWESVPLGEDIRKIHSGVPAIIADTLAYIVSSDLDDIDVKSSEWEEISKEIDFPELIKQAVVDTLVDGDGAFKISIDEDISKYPIVEFVGADKVEYEYSRGIITAVIFKTVYTIKSKRYILEERYGKGFVESKLFDDNGNERPLETVPELEGIPEKVTFNGDYIMAVPLMFYKNKKYSNRGKSIFDGGKSDCFDALDEVVSQWWDALRDGRVKQYIPESMIPRNPKDGSLGNANRFGNKYISTSVPLQEGVAQKIEVVQPDIKYEAYVSSYTNALLMCLQGLVSPATLGIDVGKMSSADAQREKKDVTGNTRNTITSALEKALPKLIEAILMTYDNMNGNAPSDYGEINVSFGEYGAPDFDSRVETVGKGATFGIMSVETQVDELWGSSKDEEWKAEEVKRIKSEKGLLEGDEPSVGDELA
ncbi:MAG: phage portal protein [Oscillospiraceae bacterium]|nr:phage portal protein [Oscillospiraceae bacterium]